MSLEHLTTTFDKVTYLQNLLVARATGNAAEANEYATLRFELLRDASIAHKLPSFIKHHGSLDSFWSWIKGFRNSYAARRSYLSEQFTPILDQLQGLPPADSFNHSASTTLTTPEIATQATDTVPRNKRNVFIVHGRDNEAKQEASRFIESLNLKAIILHEQASSGMTIIEKIEKYTNEVDFAIVLYTPCDQGRGYHEGKQNPKDRARQNVVFEHGYLMAKLGRKNVCALVKGEIETPNDVSGVVYVLMDHPGAWKLEIVNELRACGYHIKF